MPQHISKLNPEWVKEARDYFKEFLQMTQFPHPVRNGIRGSRFTYPEWVIIFIAVLAVKCQVKTYLGIHRVALQYWDLITEGLELPPISESQLRDRLKKICHFPRRPASFIFQVFSPESLADEGECGYDAE